MATPSYASPVFGQYRRAALSAIALARQNAARPAAASWTGPAYPSHENARPVQDMSPEEKWSTLYSRIWGYSVRRPDSDPRFMAVRAHHGTPQSAAIPFGPDSLRPTHDAAVRQALAWLAGDHAAVAGPFDPDLWMYGVVFDMDAVVYPNPVAEWIDPSYLR